MRWYTVLIRTISTCLAGAVPCSLLTNWVSQRHQLFSLFRCKALISSIMGQSLQSLTSAGARTGYKLQDLALCKQKAQLTCCFREALSVLMDTHFVAERSLSQFFSCLSIMLLDYSDLMKNAWLSPESGTSLCLQKQISKIPGFAFRARAQFCKSHTYPKNTKAA